MNNRITPEHINKLTDNQVFVFGSNLSGIHGKGAARMAHQYYNAEWGIGVGFTGVCYAIPTKDYGILRTLKLNEIKIYVNDFIETAKQFSDYTFLVTRIGCGLAGYRDEEIATLFKDAIDVENIFLPESFWNIIK